METVRQALSIFALLNAACWAALAAAWIWRPGWAERLPLELGTHERYIQAAPAWGRLALDLAGFWAVAAALYLTGGLSSNAPLVIGLFGLAAAFLMLAVLAAGRVYDLLKAPRFLPSAADGGQ